MELEAAKHLLLVLQGRGVRVRLAGEKLRAGPPERLTPEDLVRLREHKAQILALLRGGWDAEGEAAERERLEEASASLSPFEAQSGKAALVTVEGLAPVALDEKRWEELRSHCEWWNEMVKGRTS